MTSENNFGAYPIASIKHALPLFISGLVHRLVIRLTTACKQVSFLFRRNKKNLCASLCLCGIVANVLFSNLDLVSRRLRNMVKQSNAKPPHR